MRSLVQFGCATLVVGVAAFAFAGAAGKDSAVKPMKFDIVINMTLKRMPAGKGKPGAPPGPMIINGTVWMKSKDRARMEMTMPQMGQAAGGKQVIIMDKDTIYAINDAQKIVVKMSKNAMAGKAGMASTNLSSLAPATRDLEAMGLKKSGTENVGRDACDVFKMKTGEGATASEVTMWIRQSDHLTLKSELKSAMIDQTTEVKKIDTSAAMPDSLFVVPSDYKMTDMSATMAKAMEKGKQAAGQSKNCMSNLKNLALAIRMYSTDHNDKLPDNKKWEQEIKAYVKNPEVLKCALAKGKGPSYKMSSKCQGDWKAIDGAGTIMLFECDANGKPDYVRHNGMINLAFADGHCKVYARGSIKPGMWTPQAGD